MPSISATAPQSLLRDQGASLDANCDADHLGLRALLDLAGFPDAPYHGRRQDDVPDEPQARDEYAPVRRGGFSVHALAPIRTVAHRQGLG